MNAVIIVFIGIVVYFMPFFMAIGKKNSFAIFTLDLLLGWTVVGWVAALIWAMMTPRIKKELSSESGIVGY